MSDVDGNESRDATVADDTAKQENVRHGPQIQTLRPAERDSGPQALAAQLDPGQRGGEQAETKKG